jgi:hypothetical protein
MMVMKTAFRPLQKNGQQHLLSSRSLLLRKNATIEDALPMIA